MIGGRVLDASALVAFASQSSVYAAALVWAIEESIVLVCPRRRSPQMGELEDKHRPVLEVLVRFAGARARGEPLVTEDAAHYARFGELEIELP